MIRHFSQTMTVIVATGMLVGAGAMRADATPLSVDFNFNTVALSSGNGSDTAVQTYMNNALSGTGASVTVAGATATNYYTGDLHVVGPLATSSTDPSYSTDCSAAHGGSTGINCVQPLTLGSSDGPATGGAAPGTADPFSVRNGAPTGYQLASNSKTAGTNDTFIDTENSTEIDMAFSGMKITSVTFDYEIFPNATCTSSSNCPTPPDFTFIADGTTYVHQVASAPSTSGSGSPYNNSAVSTSETSYQLGPQTVTINFATAVTSLAFLDWPVTIGIDNLRVTGITTPEPASLLLLGTGLTAIVARRRRRAQKAS